MFEELVADILTRTLGKYIVELNGKSINISIWNGKVELYNLTTKPDIFESLNLPLIITKSCVKELTIVIPWKSLTTLPFQITLRGVHIDITPKTTFFYNEKDAVELAARERKDALDRFEMIQQLSDSKSGDYQSMWSSIAKKVSENLEVVIEDVGITYNGNINEGNITLHLDSIEIKNTEVLDGCIKKKCVLNKFEMIITDENKDERVLTIPMLEFDIIINKNTGKTTLNGLVEQILFCITKPQYNKILSVIERITKYTQTMKYLYCRPSSSVHDSPQEWWKFVFIATRDYLRTRDEERNPVRVDLCSQLRERYIELFRHVHKAPWTSEATEDEQHEFDLIEEKLRIAEVIYLRRIAYRIVAEEKSVYESSRGWFGFGYTNPKLPDDLIDKIYSQTDLTESLIQDNDVVFDGSFKIQSLDLKLLDGKSSLCAGCVNDINIGFEARGVGTCLTLNIDDIKLIEEVEGIGALWQKKTTEKLLNLKIEESPIDRTYDLSILCDVSESVIHISNGYLQKVVNFLEPPTEMDFSRVKQFAEYQLQQLYSSVASQLDIFSSDPKKIELGIHIIAPIIYVHYDADVRGMDNNVAKITLGTLDISDDVFDKEHRVFKTQINNISLKLLENVRDETDSNKNIVVYPTSLLINLSLNNSSTATPKFRVICSVDPFVARLSKRKFDMILAYVFLLTSLFTSDVSFNDFQSQSNTILSSADSIQTIKKFYSTSSDEGVVNDEIIETVDDHSTTDHKTNDTNTNEDIDKSNSFESVNASLLQEFIQKRSDSTTFEIIINMDVFEVLLSQVDDLDEETIMTSVKLQKGKVLFESKPSSFSCDFTLGSLVMDNGFNSTIPYLAMSDTHSDILQQYIHDEPTLQTNPFLHCKVDVVDTSVHVVVDIDSLTIIYEPHVISEIISFMMSLALFPETEEPSETVYFYDVTVNLTKTFVLLQSTTEILSVSSLNGIAITVRMDDIVMDVDFLIKTMEMKNIKYLPSQPQYQSITSTNNNFLSIRYITGSSNDVFEIHVGEMTCNFIVQEFFDSFAIAYDDRVQKAIDLTSVRQRVEQQYEYLKKTITTTLLETPSGKATTNISLQSPTITIFTSSGQTMFYIKSLSIHDGSNGWEMLFEQMKIKTTINQFTDHFMSDFTFTLRIPITQSKTTEIEIELPCSDLSMSPHQFKLITDVFKAFFSDPQQEVPPIVNEECHSIEELPIPSNELSVRLILAIKQLNVSLKADHITHSSSVSSVLLRNLQGFVNFTTNSYALFTIGIDSIAIEDTRELVEMKEYRNVFNKKGNEQLLKLKGEYSIDFGNIQLGVELNHPCLILTPQFITQLTTVFNEMFDGLPIPMTNSEPSLSDEELKLDPPNNSLRQSIGQFNPRKNSMSSHGLTSTKELIQKTLNEKTQPSNRESTILNEISETQSANEIQTQKSTSEGKTEIQKLQEHEPIELKESEQFSPPPPLLFKKKSGKITQPVQEIIDYLNTACPLPLTFAELVLVLKANYEWKYSDYQCEYICHELISLQAVVPISMEFCHLPSLESPTTYKITKNDMSDILLDISSFQERRPLSNVPPTIPKHLITITLISTAIIAVQDDSPDTAILQVTLDAHVLHRITSIGSITTSEIKIGDVRTCFAKGRVFDPQKGIELSKELNISLQIHSDAYEDWSSLRGSVTLDQTKLLTTFTDWRLILYFISLLSKFGGSVEPTIDSETSITIDVNNFKFVLGNPLRRDPLLRVKIPTASISYRSRNDDSIVRVMGALKIDGYNPHITDYDCLLEETLVSFRRRVVTDNVHGDPMERVLTLCALNNVNVVITSDVATELRRVFGLNDWNETNEEKEGFIAIQFIDYFSDQEPLMVSVNNYGIVRLRREPTWFENLPQKREYSDLKKCVVFTSTGEGVEVPISTEGESVYTLSEGNLVANVKIQNDSSREVIFSTLLALQNHLDDEAFVTISYGDLPELTATIQSDEIYYIPPKYFEGTLTLCTVRLARFSVVLKELQEDGIHKTLFDKCILCTTQHHNIKTYTQKIIKLSPPLIIQNHLPLPFTFNTNESNLPISPLSSLTTFSSPDAFISITIAGYHQTFIPRTSNILPIYSDTHSSITLRITWTLGCVRIDAEEWIYNRSFLPLSFSIEKPTSFIHNKRITYSNTPLPLTRGTKPLYVGIGNVWSAPIRGEKAQEIIRIIDKGMTYDIIMSVEPVNGVAYQTRQVVFRPALLISNELLVPIYCRISSKSKDVLCIQPNNIKPVYGKFKIDKSLEIAADYRGVWCKIPLTQESHFQMVMCRDSDGYEQATTVFISHSDSIVVHFQEIHTSSNYVLKNATKYPLTYQYRNAKPIQLPSYHLAHLCFPNTSALSSLFITSNFTHDETFEYQLDKPSVHEALAGTLGIVYSFTYIDNGVHTLVFTHNWQEMRNSVGALLQRTTTLSKSTTITTIFELSIACKTIGIDLIDNDREEVAFCSFQDVYYTQVSSPWKTTHSSNVGKIQIDANASDVEIAVPLSCDGVTFTLDVVSQENNASLYIPECILTIQPLIISLETSFLERIISFITNLNITPPPPPPLPTPSLYPTTVTFTPPQLITFESLIISQLQLELTFSIAPSFFLNLPYNAMTAPLHLIGTSVLTINSAPLHFSTFTSTWLFITPQRLIFLFTDFYRSQATQQLLTAVSSMQLIGAPGVLVHSISSGLSDFIHFPSTLHSNGESYRHGIAQGTASLLRHSIYGVSTSITALTSTFGNLAASLSFDQDFIKSREKRTKAYGATDGFTRGISQCGTGVFDGLKGVVSQPFKGALHHGIPGFFGGIGKGLVGSVIKPLTGVIDMAATTSEGISAVSNISKQRIRVPRSSCKGRSVTSFNSEESLIARYLQTKGFGEYIAHIGDPSGWVVLTDINLVIMNTQKVILKCPHQDLKMWIRDKNVDFSYLGKRLFIINSSQNKSCRNFLRSSMKYIKLGND